MNLGTIEEQIKNWHGRKYGRVDCDVAKTMRKFGEEVGEFIEAVINGEPGPIAEEAGDVLFIMCHIVREFCGAGALNEAAVAKIGVIYERLQAKESEVRISGPLADMFEIETRPPEFAPTHFKGLGHLFTGGKVPEELLPPRLSQCKGKCNDCGARFRCLDAGVPLPRQSLQGIALKEAGG